MAVPTREERRKLGQAARERIKNRGALAAMEPAEPTVTQKPQRVGALAALQQSETLGPPKSAMQPMEQNTAPSGAPNTGGPRLNNPVQPSAPLATPLQPNPFTQPKPTAQGMIDVPQLHYPTNYVEPTLTQKLVARGKGALSKLAAAEQAITDKARLTGAKSIIPEAHRQGAVDVLKQDVAAANDVFGNKLGGKYIAKGLETGLEATKAPGQAIYAGIKSAQEGTPFLQTAADAIIGKAPIDPSELFAKMGFVPEWAKGLGLAADMATDPLNYLGGAGFARNAARKGIESAEEAATGAIRSGLDKVAALPERTDDWFTNIFGKQNLGIIPGFAQRGRNTLTTEGQIVSNPLLRDAGSIKESAGKAYQQMVDVYTPLKNAGKETYEIAHDVRRANNLANQSINHAFVDLEGNVVGKSLKDIGRMVPRGTGHQFDDYLNLRHAETRMGRGEKVYDDKLQMTVPKVQARIAMLESRYPQFVAAAKEWDNYFKNLRELGVQSGLISQEQADAMFAKNPFYTPQRRQFKESEKFSNPFLSTAGIANQRAPIKELTQYGSTRKIVDPFRSAIEQTGAFYNAAMRNRVLGNVYNELKKDPQALDGIIGLAPTGEASKAGVGAVKHNNVVSVMVNGEPVKMVVHNKKVYDALVALDPDDMSAVLKIFNVMSRAIKRGATGVIAPTFAVRSLTTDVITGAIQSKQPVKFVFDYVHAIVSSLANALPKGTPGFDRLRSLAEEFERAGGHYEAALMGDSALNRSVRGMKRQHILHPRNLVKAATSPIWGTWKALEGVGNMAENLPRMAAYKQELRSLGGAQTEENVRKAMRASQEITTNYSRKGRVSQDLEAVVPYSNAAVQGIRRFAVQWKDHPVKTAAMVAGTVVLPKLWEYSQFSNDPDYQQLTAREKYRNLIYSKNADGTFNKIPMPPEYAGMGAFMVDMLTSYKDDRPVDWGASADALLNAYTPPWISGFAQGITQGTGPEGSLFGLLNSTSISPLIALSSNTSFTGAPIVPRDLQDKSPGQQYDERTSKVSKWITKNLGINMSPIKMDYILKAYGGDIARLGLPLTSDIGQGSPKQAVLKNFIVDPVFTNTLSNDYYKLKQSITNAKADYEGGQGVPLPDWYDDKVAHAMTTTAKGSISKQLSLLREDKNAAQVDKTLSPSQKAQKLREIQSKMNQILLDAVTEMQKSGVPK